MKVKSKIQFNSTVRQVRSPGSTIEFVNSDVDIHEPISATYIFGRTSQNPMLSFLDFIPGKPFVVYSLKLEFPEVNFDRASRLIREFSLRITVVETVTIEFFRAYVHYTGQAPGGDESYAYKLQDLYLRQGDRSILIWEGTVPLLKANGSLLLSKDPIVKSIEAAWAAFDVSLLK
jgi:hypothetical protein